MLGECPPNRNSTGTTAVAHVGWYCLKSPLTGK